MCVTFIVIIPPNQMVIDVNNLTLIAILYRYIHVIIKYPNKLNSNEMRFNRASVSFCSAIISKQTLRIKVIRPINKFMSSIWLLFGKVQNEEVT